MWGLVWDITCGIMTAIGFIISAIGVCAGSVVLWEKFILSLKDKKNLVVERDRYRDQLYEEQTKTERLQNEMESLKSLGLKPYRQPEIMSPDE